MVTNKPTLTPKQAIATLKKNSDVFCPVMSKLQPLTHKQHFTMCLETLRDMGYTLVKLK